jgi:hypothetical protein
MPEATAKRLPAPVQADLQSANEPPYAILHRDTSVIAFPADR